MLQRNNSSLFVLGMSLTLILTSDAIAQRGGGRGGGGGPLRLLHHRLRRFLQEHNVGLDTQASKANA